MRPNMFVSIFIVMMIMVTQGCSSKGTFKSEYIYEKNGVKKTVTIHFDEITPDEINVLGDADTKFSRSEATIANIRKHTKKGLKNLFVRNNKKSPIEILHNLPNGESKKFTLKHNEEIILGYKNIPTRLIATSKGITLGYKTWDAKTKPTIEGELIEKSVGIDN